MHAEARTRLQRAMAEASQSDERILWEALQFLAKWRSTLIQNTVIAQHGPTVIGGPFAGMQFVAASAEGCHVPKLLGCYERELHPVIERIVAAPYEVVINVGCAEGYYAIGLARRMPKARAIACDTNPHAQRLCRQLAERNEVQDRIEIRGLFEGGDFAAHGGPRCLVLCDIEGAERELLDPRRFPALVGMDVLVECHDCFIPNLSVDMAIRFGGTHDVERIERGTVAWRLPGLFDGLSDLDRLLAAWEWRVGPTPWLMMRARGESRLPGRGKG